MDIMDICPRCGEPAIFTEMPPRYIKGFPFVEYGIKAWKHHKDGTTHPTMEEMGYGKS